MMPATINANTNSSDPKPMNQPRSPHLGFYRTFGRPIAKVFFGAVFVYQGFYWLWLKLEIEETKAKKQLQIESLEARLRDVRMDPQSRDSMHQV